MVSKDYHAEAFTIRSLSPSRPSVFLVLGVIEQGSLRHARGNPPKGAPHHSLKKNFPNLPSGGGAGAFLPFWVFEAFIHSRHFHFHFHLLCLNIHSLFRCYI